MTCGALHGRCGPKTVQEQGVRAWGPDIGGGGAFMLKVSRSLVVGVLGLVVKEDQEVLGEKAVQVFRTPLEGAEEQPWEDLSLS